MSEGERDPRNESDRKHREKSFILHTDPFTVVQCALLFTLIFVFAVVLPVLQFLREWFR